MLTNNHHYLPKILGFLTEIGIVVNEKTLPDDTFLPGLELGPSCIYVDYKKLKYPGDLLHEAGHLAVTTPEQRLLAGTGLTAENQPWPTDGPAPLRAASHRPLRGAGAGFGADDSKATLFPYVPSKADALQPF